MHPDIEKDLASMRLAGFFFVNLGPKDLVTAVRAIGAYTDTLTAVPSQDMARGVRMLRADVDAMSGGRGNPSNALWECEGTIAEIVRALKDLPADWGSVDTQ